MAWLNHKWLWKFAILWRSTSSSEKTIKYLGIVPNCWVNFTRNLPLVTLFGLGWLFKPTYFLSHWKGVLGSIHKWRNALGGGGWHFCDNLYDALWKTLILENSQICMTSFRDDPLHLCLAISYFGLKLTFNCFTSFFFIRKFYESGLTAVQKYRWEQNNLPFIFISQSDWSFFLSLSLSCSLTLLFSYPYSFFSLSSKF